MPETASERMRRTRKARPVELRLSQTEALIVRDKLAPHLSDADAAALGTVMARLLMAVERTKSVST